MPGITNQFVTINPDELKFQFELEKQVYCDLKVANTTDEHVAFKVKTTSPKKYFVRPNTGVIQPWDSCVIKVTLQAQKEYPPDRQCKDKFLLQSTKVSQQTDIDELPPNTFTKESGKVVEDCKMRVVYVFPQSGSTNAEDGLKQSIDSSNMQGSGNSDENQALQRLRDERDAAVRQTQQLQRDLERMKKQKSKKSGVIFSFKSALYVALFGIMAGFLLNVWSSASLPSTTTLPTDVSSSPPIVTPQTDKSLSSPPSTTPPPDASSSPPTPTQDNASLSSPPTPTPPTEDDDDDDDDDDEDASSSPPTLAPPTDASLSSTPTTTTTPPAHAASTPPTTTPPADSAPSTPPTE